MRAFLQGSMSLDCDISSSLTGRCSVIAKRNFSIHAGKPNVILLKDGLILTRSLSNEKKKVEMYVDVKFHGIQTFSSNGTANDEETWRCFHSLAVLVDSTSEVCLGLQEASSHSLSIPQGFRSRWQSVASTRLCGCTGAKAALPPPGQG